MSTNILEQLKREGSVALWHDYRLGHANDLSGNGNDGTLINSPTWNRNGLAFSSDGSQYVNVAHSTILNLTSFSLAAIVTTKRICGYDVFATICAKYGSGVATDFALAIREDLRDRIYLIDTTTRTWTVTRNPNGVSYIGCTVENGNTSSSLYFDGILENDTLTTAPVITTNTVDLSIGAFGGIANRGFGRTISAFLIFNKLLTATEHAQVYGQLMKTRQGILI